MVPHGSRIKVDKHKYNNGQIIGDLQGISVPDDVFSIQEYANRRWYPWHSGYTLERPPSSASTSSLTAIASS